MPHVSRMLRGLAFTTALVGAAGAQTQDPPLKSVTIAIEVRPNPVWNFAVSNNYSVPMEAFFLECVGSDGKRLVFGFNMDASRTIQTPPADHGPVQPGERRVIEFQGKDDLSGAHVSLSAVVFADGHYEGRQDALDKLFTDRAVQAADLTFWVAALETQSGETDAQLAARLRQKDLEHQTGAAADPSGIRGAVRSALGVKRPEGDLRLAVERLRDRAALRLTMATRHLHPPAEPRTPQHGPSAEAVIIADALFDVIAVIENHAMVPLEAWRFAPESPAVRLPEIVQDKCTSIDRPPVRGNTTDGPVPPGGRREMVLYHGDNLPPGPTPKAKLTMVLFSDFSFEGSSKDRDALYRTREKQAGERAFWVEAYSAALAQPTPAAVALLLSKAEESQKRGDGLATSMASNIKNFAALAERSPDFFRQMLTRERDRLDHERTLLLRHTLKVPR